MTLVISGSEDFVHGGGSTVEPPPCTKSSRRGAEPSRSADANCHAIHYFDPTYSLRPRTQMQVASGNLHLRVLVRDDLRDDLRDLTETVSLSSHWHSERTLQGVFLTEAG